MRVESCRNRVFVLALLGTAWITTRLIPAQQMPTAVITDPVPDKQFPPGLSVLAIPSNGSKLMRSYTWQQVRVRTERLCSCTGCQDTRSTGTWHSQFDERDGTYLFSTIAERGVLREYCQSSAIEDTAAVVRFLRDPANVATYRIDPRRLVIIGHSFGGFLAGYVGSHDPDISAIGIISATNLGRINVDPKDRDTRLKRWQIQLHPVHGATAADLFSEAERHAKEWTTCSGLMHSARARYCL